MRRFLILGLIVLFSSSSARALPPEIFPVDQAMRVRVDFWKKVYTEITSEEAFLHDSEDLSVIYKKISYAGQSPRARQRLADDEKRSIQATLRSIVRKKRQDLNDEEARILGIIGNREDAEILEMCEDIRRQQGLRDRYFEGLVRAHPYMERIQSIFVAEGLPKGLGYLPHVESSFNYRAYSKVGAAGMWQFMRSSARVYKMKMNYLLDERRDPLISTKAAARFLRDNYNRLGAWPLAITAYNHGPKSIERAVAQHGTRDLSQIIEKYENRRFGFASKNFYATFMATAEISENPEKYFPEYPKRVLPDVVEISLKQRMTMDQIAKVTGYSKEQLQDFNLALRPAVFRSNFYLPKDFSVRIPVTNDAKLAEIQSRFATTAIAAREEVKVERTEHEYTVRSGDNLTTIAREHGIEVAELVYANQIERPSALRPGTQIRIPVPGSASPPRAKAVDVVATVTTPVIAAAKPEAPKAGVAVPPVEPPASAEVRARQRAGAVPKLASNMRPLDEILETEFRSVEPQNMAGLDDFANKEAAISEPEIVGSPRDAQGKNDSAAENPGWFARIFGGSSGPKVAPESHPGAAAETPADEANAPVADSGKSSNGDFDPSHYDFDIEKVRPKEFRITVEVDETLGHYAEWSRSSPEQIRRLNRIRSGIRQGQRLLIPIAEGDSMSFHLQRIRYHQAIEEDLFMNYKVAGFSDHLIKRGETIAAICKDNDIPFWLLRKYQEGRLQTRLAVGQKLRIPNLVAVKESDAPLAKPANPGDLTE